MADDYHDGQQEEFSNYRPTTIDPSPWTLIGTVAICFSLFVASLCAIGYRRCRKRVPRTYTVRRYELDMSPIQTHSQVRGLTVQFDPALDDNEVFSQRVNHRRDWRENRGRNISTTVQEGEQDTTFSNQLKEALGPSDTDNETSSESGSEATTSTEDYHLMGSKSQGSFQYLGVILDYDREMKKLLSLAIPYSLANALESFFSLVTLAIIGKILGTRALSAYIMVYYAVKIITLFLEGLLSSLTVMCSQAIGAGKHRLAGQYVQIAIVLYELLYAPQVYFWWNHVDDLVLWLGFDQEVAENAQGYLYFYIFHTALDVVHSGVVYLLEVCGHAKFTAVAGAIHGGFTVTVIFLALLKDEVPLFGKPSLPLVGFIDLASTVLFFTAELLYIHRQRWLDDYARGLVGRFALCNCHVVKNFLNTAIPLSIGHVLSYSEWEILLIMAGALGPAEVAAWGLLGEIWSAFEGFTEAIGDAAEVRCALLLGAGQHSNARLLSHKALLLSVGLSAVLAATLLLTKDYVPTWITDDRTLQSMVQELLPLISVGILVLALGTVSFHLVGSTGRYSLATAVHFFGSWLITLPLAALSCFYLRWNLEGLVSAFVIGCMTSGMLNYVILCKTNWKKVSVRIVHENAKFSDEGGAEAGLVIEGALGPGNAAILSVIVEEESAQVREEAKEEKEDGETDLLEREKVDGDEPERIDETRTVTM